MSETKTMRHLGSDKANGSRDVTARNQNRDKAISPNSLNEQADPQLERKSSKSSIWYLQKFHISLDNNVEACLHRIISKEASYIEALERIYHECLKPSSMHSQHLIRECSILSNIEFRQIKVWYMSRRNVVEDHLVVNGFVDGYTKWIFHGEGFSSRNTPHQRNDDESSNVRDDIDGLLHDTFRNVEGELEQEEGMREALSEDAKRFFKLLEEGKQELYPGCENFTKLSFIIRLYLLKSLHGLSNVAFSNMLELLKEAFPFAQLPESFNKARNMIKDLGLYYEKIHACPNDCMLFWNDNVKADNCSVCGSSRWKSVDNALNNKSSKIPAKVLRLGLSSDGFNPFRTLSISHSTWLVMLMNYNLSPWICMKPEYIMLSMIIPALLWTVFDFPALGILSGWSTKGKLACPICNYDTCSQYLKHSHKMCYLGHRRFLPPDHPSRKDKKSFDGSEEHRPAPTPLKGAEVFEELLEFNNIFDKKSKDHINSRYDLQEMGIQKELQSREDDDRSVAVRKVLPKNVSLALIRLGNFFRAICRKVIRRRDLDKIQSEIVEITCDLKKIFHPTFFDIMPYLPIHLVNEIKLGGPAHLRWMYSIERNLCKYKTFTRFSRYPTAEDECPQILSPIFPMIGHPIGSKKKKNTFLMDPQLCFEAHRYALFNTGDEQGENFIESNAWERERNHSREFNNWFAEKVKNIEVPDYLRWLAKGPNTIAKRYAAYFINGYRFHTIERDSRCKTQNSGVTLSATTDSFASSRDQNPIDGEVIYSIQDIIEIDYWGCFSVVLFRCDWFQDPVEKDVYYARNKVPIDLYDLEEENCPNIEDAFWREPNDDIGSLSGLVEVDVGWSRDDVPVDVVDIPSNVQHSHNTIIETSEEEDEFDDTDWDRMESDD
ncbi:uncharacterized protein LOC142168999 [Nicotiana tabacum]|uniref:Uncharacterized protein LOC142168999 n=1 Tax=Nicotiana tabacum TaxID=4097 RepID=A0AC58SMT9_TOBAC